jgi:hypothetical protein
MAKMKQIQIDIEVSRVIEANRGSFSEKENDILRRLLLTAPARQKAPVIVAVTQMDAPQFGSRSRGHWQVKLGTEIVAATSLKDAYCNLIRLAHEHDTGFLDRFSQQKAKTRYFVARRPEALYISSPHLAKDHALELVKGWFVDTNLSESQVSLRIRVAAREAGFAYGNDVWVKDRGRLI